MDQSATISEPVDEVRFSIPEDDIRARLGVSRAGMNRLRGPEFGRWCKGLNGRIFWSEKGLEEAAADLLQANSISPSPEASADPDVAPENGAPEGVAPVSVSATPEPQVQTGSAEPAPGSNPEKAAPVAAAFVVATLPEGVFVAVVQKASGYLNDALVLGRREGAPESADLLRIMVGKGRRHLFRTGMRVLCRPRFGTAGVFDFEGNPDLPEKGRRWPRRPGTW